MHFAFCILHSAFCIPPSVHRGKFYNKIKIVGLHLCLVRCLVAYGLAATLTAVQDDISALGIRHGGHGLQGAAARVGAISGIDIHVQAPQAKWAMVARGVAKGLDLLAAMRANKAVVVFGKSFYFHNPSKNKIKLKLSDFDAEGVISAR